MRSSVGGESSERLMARIRCTRSKLANVLVVQFGTNVRHCQLRPDARNLISNGLSPGSMLAHSRRLRIKIVKSLRSEVWKIVFVVIQHILCTLARLPMAETTLTRPGSCLDRRTVQHLFPLKAASRLRGGRAARLITINSFFS